MKIKSLFSVLAMVAIVAVVSCGNPQPADQKTDAATETVETEAAPAPEVAPEPETTPDTATVVETEQTAAAQCTGHKEGCCDKKATDCKKTAENKQGDCCKDKAAKQS